MASSEIVYSFEYPQRLSVAVIGAGSRSARCVLPCLRYLPVDIVAVADPDRARVIQIARQFGAQRVYTDYQALLDKEEGLQAALISLPSARGKDSPYPAVVPEVLQSGAHAWIDAPAGGHAADVTKLYTNAALKGHTYLMAGFRRPFMPGYEALKTLLAQRKLALQSYSLWCELPANSLAGSLDVGEELAVRFVHPLALVTDLFEGAKSMMWAWHSDKRGLSATLVYGSGAVGTITCVAPARAPRCRESLSVEAGGETFAVIDGCNLVRQTDAATVSTSGPLDQLLNQADARGSLTLSGYLGSLRHFSTALLAGERVARMNIMHLLHLLTVQDALADKSERQWLAL